MFRKFLISMVFTNLIAENIIDKVEDSLEVLEEDISSEPNKELHEKLLSTLENNEEFLAFILYQKNFNIPYGKQSSMMNGRQKILEDLININCSLKDLSCSTDLSVKMSNLAILAQGKKVNEKFMIDLSKKDEINEFLEARLKFSIHLGHIEAFLNILNEYKRAYGLSDEKFEKLLSDLDCDEIRDKAEEMYLIWVPSLYLSIEDIDQLSHEKIDLFTDISLKGETFFKYIDVIGKVKVSNEFKPSLDFQFKLGALINNFVTSNSNDYSKELKKSYEKIDKMNRLKLLNLRLTKLRVKLDLLQEQRMKLKKDVLTYDKLFNYLKCEKEYMEILNKYANIALEIKKVNGDFRYYIYEVINNAN